MRGIFTCGVLDVFMENGITFDGAAGISAGAIFGCNYKSGQIGRTVRYNKKYCSDPRYCSIRSLIKTGDLYGVDFCYHEIPDTLDPFDWDTFNKNPMEFYVGATDIMTGKIIYHKCDSDNDSNVEWMRASASMPLLSRPVEIDGLKLLDGGMVDPIPYSYMKIMGYEKNIVILTQPKDYIKRKSGALPLFRIMLKKYPKVYEVMSVRHIVYAEQIKDIEAQEALGNAYIIRPSESLGIKRTENNPDELERVYREGRSEALSQLSRIKDFLEVL